MGHVTRILSAIEQGEPNASEALLPLVYDELRKLASQRLRGEKPGQTLQPTALVHEAYLRLVDVEAAQRWNSRGHFFAAAAEAMRRVLADIARSKHAQKRSGRGRQFELQEGDVQTVPLTEEILDFDEALAKLQEVDSQAAQVVQLRIFGGMTFEEIATFLEISPRTAKRNWAFARAWLGREMASYAETDP